MIKHIQNAFPLGIFIIFQYHQDKLEDSITELPHISITSFIDEYKGERK